MSNFGTDWLGLIKAEGPKRGENVALKSQEYYYIVSNYNNVNQLTLFLVLIGKFDQKSNQTFILDRSEVGI